MTGTYYQTIYLTSDGVRQRTRVFSELQSHYVFADRFGFRRFIDGAVTPERCVEAYHLQRTRFECRSLPGRATAGHHQRKATPKMKLTSGLVGAEAQGPIG